MTGKTGRREIKWERERERIWGGWGKMRGRKEGKSSQIVVFANANLSASETRKGGSFKHLGRGWW